MLVAIDGPAGSGKSTVARALARRLGFGYLDSGAMYRCVGLLSLEQPDIEPAALAQAANIELLGAAVAGADDPSGADRRGDTDGREGSLVLLDGRDVTAAIRAPDVSEAASRIAADPDVRKALVVKQRTLIARGDWVAEGRDVGTVVAPDAELKVFLTADPHERARRRARELGVEAEVVLAEQALRDERDKTRQHSPLAPAPGAVILDTTGLGVDQVTERIAGILTRC